jgi:hypothetical protein
MVTLYSNQKLLQVLASEPDPDAGWYIEAWDRKNAIRQNIDMQISKASFNQLMNAVGGGRIEVPLSDPIISEPSSAPV